MTDEAVYSAGGRSDSSGPSQSPFDGDGSAEGYPPTDRRGPAHDRADAPGRGLTGMTVRYSGMSGCSLALATNLGQELSEGGITNG